MAMDLSAVAPWAALIGALLFFLWLDLHFFARGREPNFREGVIWSIGWLVLSLLRRRWSCWALDGARGRRPLHDRLPDRALAVARQPVRLHPAVRVLRRARRSCGARLLFWGIVAALVAARPRDRRRHRADRAVPLRDLRARRAAARARLADLARRRGERRPRPQPDGPRSCASSSRSRASTTAPLVRARRTGRATRRRCSSASWRSSFADIAFAIDSIPAAFAITQRPAPHLDGQRLRAARPAGAVRARRGPDAALPLPRRDDRGRARRSSA